MPVMRNIVINLLFYISACALPSLVEAQTLAALLERARAGEPTYLGARTQVLAAEARKAQAIGAMLPQLSVRGSVNSNDRY